MTDAVYRWVARRDHLHAGLTESARRHGVNLVVNARVEKMDHSGEQVIVTTTKSQTYTFDLLIGSDGIKSFVRKSLFPDVAPKAVSKVAAYRAVIPYEELFAKVPEARAIFGNTCDAFGGENGYLIFYPLSGGKELNLVAAHHVDYYMDSVEDVKDINVMRDFYQGYSPMLRKIVDLIPSTRRWPLLVIPPMKTWSNERKNVVLLGDAVHSMQMHMAQGAGTAMEDGAFLGRMMSEVVRGVITIPEAVALYEKHRMPRAWIKQQSSYVCGELYMYTGARTEDRNRASAPEVAAVKRNPVKPAEPPTTYRPWQLWCNQDSIPSIHNYDAEADADWAVCDYLQSQSDMDERILVAPKLREKWWGYIEPQNDEENSRAKL